jgi:hypothetical protein
MGTGTEESTPEVLAPSKGDGKGEYTGVKKFDVVDVVDIAGDVELVEDNCQEII